MSPRSYLFVPGHRPERFDKAWAAGADRLVLDLEDAVAPADKARARSAVAAAWATWPAERRLRSVLRLNDAASPEHAADLRLLAALPGLREAPPGLMLAKADRPEVLAGLHGRHPRCPLLPLVESARGVLAAPALAQVPGVAQLVFGTLDYALDLGVAPEPEALASAAGWLVLASRAAGLPGPVAGVTPALDDPAALLADWAWARRLGFAAKLCIHPRQVAPLHAALAPGADEIAWARRVLDAAQASAGNATQVDGRMVDAPVLHQAQALLQRAGLA